VFTIVLGSFSGSLRRTNTVDSYFPLHKLNLLDSCTTNKITTKSREQMASFSQLIDHDVPVLVDFKADWCQPCKMMAPILKQVKQNFKDQIKIIKIDIDQNPTIAQKYAVKGVPTLILFKKGVSVWRQSGVLQAHQINTIISSHI
jgi:thioredoxin